MPWKVPRRAVLHALTAVAAGAAGSTAAGAQTSQTCEFAFVGWLGTQMELREARRAERTCNEARRNSCTAEQGRVRLVEERLRLLRNYIDGYCRR